MPAIIYEREERIAIITINRPEAMNSLNREAREILSDAWVDFRDDPDCWAAILTGAGEKAFCAGLDLREVAQSGLPSTQAARPTYSIVRDFELWKPVIAAVNGYALGGGLELALACDIIVAGDNASFGLPEVTRALMPGAGGTQRLPRQVPIKMAMQMLLTGERISAQEAYRIGLINKVVPPVEVMPAARAMAQKICENGPLAVRSIKECTMRGLDMPLAEGMKLESLYGKMVAQSEDAKEGPRAFAEKRKPEYKGQ